MEKEEDSESPPATPVSFSRPRPRPPRSPAQSAKIRVQNRRREYLEKHPAYFASAEHEFADPDLYDTLVRRFQSPAEREAERRAGGWGKTLESSLMRGEARLARVAPSSRTSDAAAGAALAALPPSATSASSAGRSCEGVGGDSDARRDPGAINFAIDADLAEDGPATREEGRAAWEEFLRERFVRGGDEDFDYGRVDGDEGLDSMEERDREEAYFDEVEPEWADDDDDDDSDSDESDDEAMGDGEGTSGGQRRPKRERILLGQTGIQDY